MLTQTEKPHNYSKNKSLSEFFDKEIVNFMIFTKNEYRNQLKLKRLMLKC